MSEELKTFFENNLKRMSYASWVDMDKGYLFIETPKVACTTIKVALQQISGFALPEKVMQIHYRTPAEKFVANISNYLECLDDIASDKVFKFAFVRNPYTRLISAYQDKIVNSKGDFWERYRTQIRVFNDLDSHQEIQFKHFINYVCALPDNKRDIHWRSQFNLLKPQIIPYNFIGKQERFNNDFSYVLERLQQANPEPFLAPTNQTEPVNLADFYDEELLSMVASAFEKDFSFFNYEP